MISFIVCLLLLLGGAGQAAAATAENDLFSEAESRYLGKNYAAALESYNVFAAAYPLSERIADVQYRRTVCLGNSGLTACSGAEQQNDSVFYPVSSEI